MRLRYRVYQTTEGYFDGWFVLDKILHNHLNIAPSILQRNDVIPIFLLRKPPTAIQSIMKDRASYLKVTSLDFDHNNPSQSLQYYVERLHQLQQYTATIRRPGIFIEAEKLLESSASTLQLLREQLGLNTALSERYTMFKYTGKPVHGDSSKSIRNRRTIRI